MWGAASASARPSPTLSRLCAPLLPPKAPLPRTIGLPRLAPALLSISANARSHHALCRVGVWSPSDNARYDASWYVFPSHVVAVADLSTLDPHEIYASVKSLGVAAGFPKPGYILTGTFDYFGHLESIITVSFVDGPAFASASMLGGGTRAQATTLAHWVESDLGRILKAK